MSEASWTTLTRNSRRSVRLIMPRTQLQLALGVLGISLGFAALFAWHAHSAYAGLYDMLASTAPEPFLVQIREQASDFVIVSLALGVAYVGLAASFCIAFTHRMLGPIVALRRQIHSLQNGSYHSRVILRSQDADFEELAQDLNGLAQALESEKPARGARSY